MIECSILVPVYNAVRWLPAFVRCIAKQKLADCELIFLDDASSDNSMGILKDELATYGMKARILAHGTNLGVSVARQTLLDAATGEYVIFADPDDWMDANMYKELVVAAKETGADVVWEDFFDGEDKRCVQQCNQDARSLLKAILHGKVHGATWNKLIRRDFIAKCGARFLEGRVALCEDMDFICQVLAANPKIAYHDGCNYHYRVVADSLTHGLSINSFRSLMRVEAHLRTLLTGEDLLPSLKYWCSGNRMAAFLSERVDDDFFYTYAKGYGDIDCLSANKVLKILYRIAINGYRQLALHLYRLLLMFVRMLNLRT